MLIEMNPRPVDVQTALAAHKLATQLHKSACTTPGEQGIRALKAHDARMMRWLEGAVEAMDRADEHLRGETRRARSGVEGATSGELGLWRGALETAQRVEQTPHGDLMIFAYIYGAAAVFAGIAPRPHELRSA